MTIWSRIKCALRGHFWAYVRTTPEGKVFQCRRCGLKFQPPGALWRDG